MTVPNSGVNPSGVYQPVTKIVRTANGFQSIVCDCDPGGYPWEPDFVNCPVHGASSSPTTSSEHRPAPAPSVASTGVIHLPKADRSYLICDCDDCDCESALECLDRDCVCCGQALNGAHA